MTGDRMTGMPCLPVSVIVAVRNEECRIVPCLQALTAFDEVIVADSESTDRTVALAREQGVNSVPFVWNGRYPKKRQWCLDHLQTRHEWIFFVDADEIVTPELIREIAALPFDAAGYFVRGRYIWRGKRLGHGLMNNKLVLFNRRKFEFPVIDDLDIPGMGEMEGHYQPVLKPAFAREKIGQINAPLDHNAMEGEGQWLNRHRRYAAWERGMNDRAAWPRDPVRWRQALKTVFRKLPARGAIAFCHCYFWKRGFLDGAAGFDFARKRAAYYRMIQKG